MNSADRRLPRACQSFRTWLTDSVQGEPDAAHARHLEGCKPCAGLWQVAGATRAARADLLAATPDPAAVGALLDSLVPPVEAPAADGANEAIDPVPPTYDVPPAPTPLLAMDAHRAEPMPSATAVRSARPLIAWAAVVLIGLGGLCALAAHEVWWPFGNSPSAEDVGQQAGPSLMLNDKLVKRLQVVKEQKQYTAKGFEVANEGLRSPLARHRWMGFGIYADAKRIPPKSLILDALEFMPSRISHPEGTASEGLGADEAREAALLDERAMTTRWAIRFIWSSLKAGERDWDPRLLERFINHPYKGARQFVIRALKLIPDYQPPAWLLDEIRRDVVEVRRLAKTWLEEQD